MTSVKRKRRVVVIGDSLLKGNREPDMQTGPNSQGSLLSPRGLGKGHYWKTLQSSKTLIIIDYWLFKPTAMK